MYKLSLDIEQKLSIMSKHGLTADEWLLIELLYIATESDAPQPQYLYEYFNCCAKTTLPIDMLKSLQDKNVFASSYRVPEPGENFDIDEIEFSKTFLANYFKLSFEAGQEMFNLYPPYMTSKDGRMFPMKNVIKAGFDSEQALFAAYSKRIRHSAKKHAEVMDILQWAIDNHMIHFTVCDFVVTKKWEDLEKIRSEGGVDKFAIKIDTLEDI